MCVSLFKFSLQNNFRDGVKERDYDRFEDFYRKRIAQILCILEELPQLFLF